MAIKTSLWDTWGPQPLFDFLVLKSMLKAMGDVVSNTYLPVLRLAREDRQALEQAYADVLSLREEASSRFAPPRERWAVLYGNFIRELEWACGELRKDLSKEDYEDLTTRSISDGLERWIGSLMPSLAKAMSGGRGASRLAESRPAGAAKPKRKRRLAARLQEAFIANVVFRSFNPASFLVGPIEFRSISRKGVVIYIPDCWMHKVVSNTEPQTEACVQMCKGGCERFFGEKAPIGFYFDPNLPSFDCTLRVSWSGRAIDIN